jgi:ribosomal protein L7/L12
MVVISAADGTVTFESDSVEQILGPRVAPKAVISIFDPVSLTQDFTHLQSISREEQQKQLRDLAARGQLVTAIYIARKLYGSTLVEAKQMVEGLAEEERRS